MTKALNEYSALFISKGLSQADFAIANPFLLGCGQPLGGQAAAPEQSRNQILRGGCDKENRHAGAEPECQRRIALRRAQMIADHPDVKRPQA
jgi:hypothetical protein